MYWAALLEAGRDGRGRERGRGAPGRGGGGDGLRRASRPPTCGRAITARPRRGSRSGSTSRPAGWSWIRWDHSTSRAQQPQLHSHVTVLNRAETISDGVIRALASRGFKPIKQAADAIYTKVFEETLDRLQRGGVRDPRGRQGARDRRVQLAAAGQGVLPHRRHHRAAGRARRAVPRRPTGGTRARSRPGGSTAPRGGRPARRRTTRWRPRRQVANWAEPVRERAGPRRWPRPTPPASGSRATGTPSSRATRRATGSRCCARRCARCRTRYATWDIGNLAAAIRRRAGPHPGGRRVAAGPGGRGAARGRPVRGGDAVGPRRRDRAGGAAPPGRAEPLPDAQRRGVRHHRAAGDRGEPSSSAPAAPARPRCPGRRWSWPGWSCRPPGSSADQQDAVLQILSSGRRGDVLIGPAGRREVPHGRRAGPGVGAADRRPGPRCGDLEHRRAGAHRGRAQRAEHQAVPAPVRARRAGPGA